MIPHNDGRHCNSCAKTVIDFTSMSDKQVQDFFIAHNNQPVCGRFKNNQVHRIVIDLPENIFQVRMPVWMRFMVACLIIFGISIFPFETTIAGKTATGISFYQGKPLVSHQAKKKTKKHKRKKKARYEVMEIPKDIEFRDIVLGGGWLSPVPELDIYNQCMNVNKKADTVDPKENITRKEPESGKEEPTPVPFTPAEFILPAILINKRKKDPALD